MPIFEYINCPGCQVLTLSYAKKHGESIVIGLAACSTWKGPQVKTTEPMVSFEVRNCSIQLGLILAREGFSKNYMGVSSRGQKVRFFHLVRADVWMDVLNI